MSLYVLMHAHIGKQKKSPTSIVCDVMPFFSVSAEGGHSPVAVSSCNCLRTKTKIESSEYYLQPKIKQLLQFKLFPAFF